MRVPALTSAYKCGYRHTRWCLDICYADCSLGRSRITNPSRFLHDIWENNFAFLTPVPLEPMPGDLKGSLHSMQQLLFSWDQVQHS